MAKQLEYLAHTFKDLQPEQQKEKSLDWHMFPPFSSH